MKKEVLTLLREKKTIPSEKLWGGKNGLFEIERKVWENQKLGFVRISFFGRPTSTSPILPIPGQKSSDPVRIKFWEEVESEMTKDFKFSAKELKKLIKILHTGRMK